MNVVLKGHEFIRADVARKNVGLQPLRGGSLGLARSTTVAAVPPSVL